MIRKQQKHNPQLWYNFFWKHQDSLCTNESVSDNNIVIAKVVQRINNKPSFMFTKFHSIDDFLKYFNNCKILDRKLYVVLRNQFRYLYVDVDYHTTSRISKQEYQSLKFIIISTINKFTKGDKQIKKYNPTTYNIPNWFIWCATRDKKFSLHCINTSIVLPVGILQTITQQINEILHALADFPSQCKLDDRVYKRHYQLWRLPLNYKDTNCSKFTLVTQKVKERVQFQYNFMNFDQLRHVKMHKNNIIKNCDNSHQVKCNKIKKKPNKYHIITNDAASTVIINKIFEQFKIRRFYGEDRNGFILKDHTCPIKKDTHKSNTGRIQILTCKNIDNSNYIVYNCFDAECQQKTHRLFISMSNMYRRPWILEHFSHCDKLIHTQLDNFIHQLLVDKHIKIVTNASSQNAIWNDNGIVNGDSIKFGYAKYIFTCFLNNNIICLGCKCNKLSLLLKAKTHQFAHMGLLAVKCNGCFRLLEYTNHTIHKTNVNIYK